MNGVPVWLSRLSPTLVQVMISQFVSLNLISDSVLTVQSLLGILSLSSLFPTPKHAFFLSLKKDLKRYYENNRFYCLELKYLWVENVIWFVVSLLKTCQSVKFITFGTISERLILVVVSGLCVLWKSDCHFPILLGDEIYWFPTPPFVI